MKKKLISQELSTFYKAAATMGAIQLITYAISFVGSVVLTRSLGPEGRGVIAWFVSLSSITMVMVQLGMNMVNNRYVADKPELAGDMAVFTVKLLLTTSLIATPFFLYYGLHHEVGAAHTPLLVIALISVPCMAIASCIGNLLMALHRTGGFNACASIQKVANTLFILLFAALGLITPETALIILALSYALQAILAFYLVRPEIAQRQRLDIRTLVTQLQLKAYMAYNYVASVLLMLASVLMPMLLVAWSNLEAAGMLAACAVLTDAMFRVYLMVSNYAFPKLMSLRNKDDKRQLKISLILVSSVGMSAVAIVLAAVAHWLIPLLFGEEFTPAIPTFRVLCIHMVLMSVQSTLYSIIHSETSGYQVMASPFFILAVMVPCAYFLIPTYGAVGGAWAMVCGAAAGVISAGWYLYGLKKKEG